MQLGKHTPSPKCLRILSSLIYHSVPGARSSAVCIAVVNLLHSWLCCLSSDCCKKAILPTDAAHANSPHFGCPVQLQHLLQASLPSLRLADKPNCPGACTAVQPLLLCYGQQLLSLTASRHWLVHMPPLRSLLRLSAPMTQMTQHFLLRAEFPALLHLTLAAVPETLDYYTLSRHVACAVDSKFAVLPGERMSAHDVPNLIELAVTETESARFSAAFFDCAGLAPKLQQVSVPCHKE